MGENGREATESRGEARAGRRMRAGWMDAKHLLLLLLAFAPQVSASHAPADSGRRISVGRVESSEVVHDGVRGASCRDLRDAEIILAEEEVRLLDRLDSRSARLEERESWQDELDRTRASLEDLDRELAAARCPARSREG